MTQGPAQEEFTSAQELLPLAESSFGRGGYRKIATASKRLIWGRKRTACTGGYYLPRPQRTYPRPPTPPAYLTHSRHTRSPDAGLGGKAVERGRLFSGVGSSAAGPAIMAPPEPDLAQKRIVTGGHWASLLVSEGTMAARYRKPATPKGRAALWRAPSGRCGNWALRG